MRPFISSTMLPLAEPFVDKYHSPNIDTFSQMLIGTHSHSQSPSTKMQSNDNQNHKNKVELRSGHPKNISKNNSIIQKLLSIRNHLQSASRQDAFRKMVGKLKCSSYFDAPRSRYPSWTQTFQLFLSIAPP
ncbi:hypothetical protein CPC08DRAFT_228627 [Agrocybe pediades]|nr:hypothetical protein CPC08DRAFT_228627 [Agrocybe pediades]